MNLCFALFLKARPRRRSGDFIAQDLRLIRNRDERVSEDDEEEEEEEKELAGNHGVLDFRMGRFLEDNDEVGRWKTNVSIFQT